MAALLVGTVSGAATATVITAHIATRDAGRGGQPPAAVTVTAAPPAPTITPPLPAAQADRATCNAWLAAGKHVDAASAALAKLPKGITVVDQAVRDNPDLLAAVKLAGAEYDKAGDTLTAGITPGATPVLRHAATTAAAALHTLATGDTLADPADGNMFHTWKEAAGTVNVLCDRLAPQ